MSVKRLKNNQKTVWLSDYSGYEKNWKTFLFYKDNNTISKIEIIIFFINSFMTWNPIESTWSVIDLITTYSTIGSNIVTIFWWIGWMLALFYFFGSKKHKAIIVSSKTFQIPLERDDISNAAWPRKIYDEPIIFEYDKNLLNPLDFCSRNTGTLQDIKWKYNPICIFWIAEMFIFFWIWYYLQDSIYIKWYRKIKEGQISFFWNPWSWTGLFSLKWFLWIRWCWKSIFNRYIIKNYTSYSQGSEVVLVIDISYKTDIAKVSQKFQGLPIIEFGIKNPDPSFLINESQVFTFSKKIKELMQNLDQQLWANWKIHIIWTLPVPFCIKLGQSIHRNWPECILYDFDCTSNDYLRIISTWDITI